jgi:hypothetical protein
MERSAAWTITGARHAGITVSNMDGKSLYSLDPDGYIVEFHQRPPAAAP